MHTFSSNTLKSIIHFIFIDIFTVAHELFMIYILISKYLGTFQVFTLRSLLIAFV
jgi:hypothetical protein